MSLPVTQEAVVQQTRSGLPPGPRGHWLWGNVKAFQADRLAFMREVARQYGGVVYLRFAYRTVWLVTEPEVIESVLVTQARQFRKHFDCGSTRLCWATAC